MISLSKKCGSHSQAEISGSSGGLRFFVLAIALRLMTWSVVTSAGESTPSLEEMWKVIQQQQAEIDSLKEQNAQLLKQVSAPQADVAAKTIEQAPVAAMETEPAPPPVNDSSGSTFDMYGFAMLDMGYQFKQNNPDWYDVLRLMQLAGLRHTGRLIV